MSEIKKVMIVDDEEEILDILEMHLERIGVEVKRFDNPINVCEQLKNESYDLLITDQNMPQMGGLALVRKIRTDQQMSGNLKYILLSTGGLDANLKPEDQEVLDKWMHGEIAKPFRFQQVADALKGIKDK